MAARGSGTWYPGLWPVARLKGSGHRVLMFPLVGRAAEAG